MRAKCLVLLLVSSWLGCGGSSSSSDCEALTAPQCAPSEGELPTGTRVIVDTEWLQQRLGDPNVQPVDTRASGYEQSRIPGAIHLRPEDLAATVDGVPSQILASGEAELVLGASGLREDAIAVVYGAPPEYDPSRVVWALRYFGHGDVRYLDGGYAAWVDGGGALDTGRVSVQPSDYTILGVNNALRVTGEWVLDALGDPPFEMSAIQLVDARSESEYEAGRIPGALSVNWTRNLDGGSLRSRRQLEALYEGLDPGQTTIAYCVSGWRSSFAWLTLTALGYDDVRLYDGSWNEWGTGGFPVER